MPPRGGGRPLHPIFATIESVRQAFEMFPLTVDGLGGAVAQLIKGKKGRRAA